MSLNRYAKNTDANHRAIVNALRMFGCSVEAITGSAGTPDLLVGHLGLTELVEVKDGSKPPSARRLNASQVAWHRRWRGRPVRVVESVDEALALLQEMRAAMTSAEACETT